MEANPADSGDTSWIDPSDQDACEVRVRSFSEILDRVTDGFIALDSDWRFTFVNNRAEELLDRKREELLGSSIWEEFPQAVDTVFYREYHRAMKKQVPVFFDEYYEPLKLWAGVRAYPSETGLSVYFTDIQERKRIEDDLRESEANYRAIFDAVNDGIFIHDSRTGRILDTNKKTLDMYGYTKEEMRTLTIEDLSVGTTPYTQLEAVAYVKKAAGGEPQAFEWLAKDKGGMRFWVEVNLKNVVLSGEQHILAVVRDITERKKSEEELLEKDRSIRQAYTDVIDAVTGGKLILMTREELDEALGEPVTEPYAFESYQEMAAARRFLREAVAENFPAGPDPNKFIVAFGEAITNAVKHADGGRFRIYRKDGTLQIEVADSGSGIDFRMLPKATLVPGFSTKPSLGIGFSVMLDLCDRVLLTTRPGNTTVVLEING
ncbi:MAG: PAS domain S-box protein [Candidatus Aquicultorales bacterium]